jgi:hypothetical protein
VASVYRPDFASLNLRGGRISAWAAGRLRYARFVVATSSGPLVSIVTPTLNQGRFIEATIRSIKCQTYARVEHIVVDGGSTDATLEILRRHEDTYELRWLSEPDAGMYDAVNKGMRQAQGEILAYLNSDDLYFPWTVDTVVEHFLRRPTVSLAYGDAVRIEQPGGRQLLQFNAPFDPRAVVERGSLVQPAVFWRRSAFPGSDPFDSGLRFAGDLDAWLRAASRGKVDRLDEVLAIDRVHPEALSKTQSVALLAEDRAMRARHRGRFPRRRAVALRARVRDAVWRRWLLGRLVLSLVTRGQAWRRFRTEGDIQISPGRLIASQFPGMGGRYLPDAIVSGLVRVLVSATPSEPGKGLPDRRQDGTL